MSDTPDHLKGAYIMTPGIIETRVTKDTESATVSTVVLSDDTEAALSTHGKHIRANERHVCTGCGVLLGNGWPCVCSEPDDEMSDSEALVVVLTAEAASLRSALSKSEGLLKEAERERALFNEVLGKTNAALNRAGCYSALFYWEHIDDIAAARDSALAERDSLREENARLMALTGQGMEEMERMRRDRDSYANSDFERQLDEARKECDVLRSFVNDIAEEDCSYRDECPSSARHYRCLRCKAVEALDRAATTTPEAGK